MNTWKVILATLVIFVTGVLTGGLLVNYTLHTSPTKHPGRPRNEARPLNNSTPGSLTNPRERLPNPANLPNRLRAGINLEFLQKLDAEVHLAADQREHIQRIIAEGQQHNKKLWEGIAPEIRRENMETQRRIREVLTPEQLRRFEELMKQNRPANRRNPDEGPQPGAHPREQRRPQPLRDGQDAPQPAPQPNP